MANFTEKQIQGMIADLRDEFGPDIATREIEAAFVSIFGSKQL